MVAAWVKYFFFFFLGLSLHLIAMHECVDQYNVKNIFEIIDNGKAVDFVAYVRNASVLEINTCNDEGYTPLDYAYMRGQILMVDALLERGAQAHKMVFDKKTIIHELLAIKKRTDLVSKKIVTNSHCIELIADLAPELYAFLQMQLHAMAHYAAHDFLTPFSILSSIKLYLSCDPYVTLETGQNDLHFIRNFNSFNAFFNDDHEGPVIGLGINALLAFFELSYIPFCYCPLFAHEYGHFLDLACFKKDQEILSVGLCDAQLYHLWRKAKIVKEEEFRADRFAHVFVGNVSLLWFSHIYFFLVYNFLTMFYKKYPDILFASVDQVDDILQDSIYQIIRIFWAVIIDTGDHGKQFLKISSNHAYFFSFLRKCLRPACVICDAEGELLYDFDAALFEKILTESYSLLDCQVHGVSEELQFDNPYFGDRIKYIMVNMVYDRVKRWFKEVQKKYLDDYQLFLSLSLSIQSKGIIINPIWREWGEFVGINAYVYDRIDIFIGSETIDAYCDEQPFACCDGIAQSVCNAILQALEPYHERVRMQMLECKRSRASSEYDDILDVARCGCCGCC